jgi:hypothetical protein
LNSECGLRPIGAYAYAPAGRWKKQKVGGERRSAALQERSAALKSASLEGKNWLEGERGLFCYGRNLHKTRISDIPQKYRQDIQD